MSTLTQLFTNIANAIRSKTGKTDQIAAENFASEIAGISTGTDTSDGTATANNIEAGKTAYVNGEKVTGNIPVVDGNLAIYGTLQTVEENLSLSHTVQEKTIYTAGSKLDLQAPLANFGNATAADVAEGKTFTAADGLLVAGTAVAGAGGPISVKTGTVTATATKITVSGLGLSYRPTNIFLKYATVPATRTSATSYITICVMGLSKAYGLYQTATGNEYYTGGVANMLSSTLPMMKVTTTEDGFTLELLNTDRYKNRFYTNRTYDYYIW